ncbi:Ubiquitin carboxyl-terminal hydrolase 20 [Bienertia sinuspersici]
MDNENPSSGFVVSDKVLGVSSDAECSQSKVISSSEENPIMGIAETENPSSDFVQFDQTLVGSSAIDELQSSKPLVESIQGGSEKIDDGDGSKAEGEIVEEELSVIPSLWDEGVNVELQRNGNEDISKNLDGIGTDELSIIPNSSEDGIGKEDLSIIPSLWSEGHISNYCNCGRCSLKPEEELPWRNNGMGWPSWKMFPNRHYPRRFCKRRAYNFRRERESEMYGCNNYMGRDYERFQYPNMGYLEPEPCPVGAGLANLGNTCFMNAILQCFTHTVPLVQGLLSLKHEASSHGADEFCVLCAVCHQIEYSLVYSGRVISPSNLVDNLSHISSYFRRYQQEDAHEFLQCLLDKLDSNWSMYEASANDSSWPCDTLVKQIFGGRIVSQVRCCKCGHNSDTYEPLIDLSLEIEDADSIEDALKSFTKVESIEETENFTCNSCKEQVKVEKQLMLDQAPSVAALHLKRFKSDGFFVEKIDKKVDFPLELDLGPYTKDLDDGHENLKYELFAVVVHVGVSSTSGHYFCYIRTSPENWYRFDDSKVTMVDEEIVLCQEAYILFYAKRNTPWFDSLIENWKVECREKILSTSPKSVLDDMDLPSTSYSARTGLHGGNAVETRDAGVEAQYEPSVGIGLHNHGCEVAETRDATGDASIAPASELLQDEVEAKAGVDTQDSAVINQASISSSSVPMSNNIDFNFDELFLMDENDANEDKKCSEGIDKIEQNSCGGACSPSRIKTTDGEPKNEVDITPSTPPRALSPDIYSDEEPAEEAYRIPTKHLKIEDKPSLSAKKSVNTLKQDMKRKEAAKYIRKSMPGGRGHLFMAAINGSKGDGLLSNKRKKHVSLRHSPKKRKVSPKRVLRPVTA